MPPEESKERKAPRTTSKNTPDLNRKFWMYNTALPPKSIYKRSDGPKNIKYQKKISLKPSTKKVATKGSAPLSSYKEGFDNECTSTLSIGPDFMKSPKEFTSSSIVKYCSSSEKPKTKKMGKFEARPNRFQVSLNNQKSRPSERKY